MESNFNRDFEEYVKRNADQFRMIPSDKVWRSINRSLHGRRRLYGLGLVLLLLLTTGSVTWVMMSNPSGNQTAANLPKAEPLEILTPVNPDRIQADPSIVDDDMNGLLSYNQQIDEDLRNSSPANSQSENITSNEEEEMIAPEAEAPTQQNNSIRMITQERRDQSIFTEYLPRTAHAEPLTAQATTVDESKPVAREEDIFASPYTIESVVNSFKPKKFDRKLTWRFYFTPTVSYRRLSENKSYLTSNPFNSATNYPFAALTDVNKAVVHKPDLGFQLGVSAAYPLTKSLKVTAGMQFNINRYDIKAFVFNGEQATINLSGAGGNTNSVTAWTYYRNYSGYKSDWLNNFYFSVSAPIGVELKVLGKDKTYLGVAGTVQPTYILSDRAYLISTDYKNYAKVPWLIRHVNVNTSFETFVSYTNKRNTRWQIGPQVRYQVLSSFQSKYPVKENLFDFGVKLGVTLNQ